MPVFPKGEGVPTLYEFGVGLGRQPRFAGQTILWYPVLAHVLTCARLLPSHLAIHGLMHDAPEMVVSHVVTSWKTKAALRREHMLLKRIYKHYNLPWPTTEEWAQVAEIDHQALIAEVHVLGGAAADLWPEPNETIVEMTQGHLEVCRSMLEPEASGAIFEEAFYTYLKLADANR